MSPASNNISSFYKYLQLLQISPASNDVSSFFKYLWLRKIPPALDYFRIHFFLVEGYLKGLVHLGSSCRSWTTLLLPCETRVNRLNTFIILKTDYNIYTDYIHRYLVEVCLYWPIGQDTRCPYMTGGTYYMIGVTNSPQFLFFFLFFFQFLPVFFFQFSDLPLLFLPTSLICCMGFDWIFA